MALLLLSLLLPGCSQSEPEFVPVAQPQLGEGPLGVVLTRHALRLVPMAPGIDENEKLTALQRGRSVNIKPGREGLEDRLMEQLGTNAPGGEAYYQFMVDLPFETAAAVLQTTERAGYSRQVLVLKAGNGAPKPLTLWPVAIHESALYAEVDTTGIRIGGKEGELGFVPCKDKQGTVLATCADTRSYDWINVGSGIQRLHAQYPEASEITVRASPEVPWSVVARLLNSQSSAHVVLSKR